MVSAASADSLGYVDEREFLLIGRQTGAVQLAHGFVEIGSVRLIVDGVPWQEGQDFRLRARSGILVPLRDWVAVPRDTAATAEGSAVVMVGYRYLPVPITDRRDLRPLGRAPDPADDGQRPGRGGGAATGSEPTAWSTGRLNVTGSKTVQVSSGSRREMTVDQNLRLNITGQLTEDIFVRAFLSDDNLPVVPEGNTEELRDIDKVLVELQAPHWQATLGDFVARRTGTVFGDYQRKLQGMSVNARVGRGRLSALAGSPRGRYSTLQIRGEESNQGPYYLGGGGGQNLFIVAGSERVTLDGVALTRGADQDYTIDYVRGTVTFTYRRLITAESDIVVEFEEGEGPYGRTVLGAGGGLAFTVPGTDLQGDFAARVTREKDDPARLRTGDLSEGDEAILAAAGDDPLLAVASGVTAVADDAGLYDEADDGGKTIYVYNADGGDYDVSFFYIGVGQGDYAVDSLTESGQTIFVHRGDGLGSYLVGRPLDLPESRTLATFTASIGDTAGSHVDGEWNLSALDRNLLSDLDQDDNDGHAAYLQAELAEQSLAVGDLSLGRLAVAGRFEDRSADFQPFQVRKTVFSYDQWGLGGRADRDGFLDEADRQTTAEAIWQTGQVEAGRYLNAKGSWGQLRHGASLEADQTALDVGWRWRGGKGQHQVQRATAVDGVDPLDNRRYLRRHQASWRLGPVVPSSHYNVRSWRDDAVTDGRTRGFRHTDLGGGLGSAPGGGLSWRIDFARGLADSLVADTWRLQRDSRTWSGSLNSGAFLGMRLVGEGTVRRILSPRTPEQTTRLARVNLSGRWENLGSDWSLSYRVDNSRTEVMDAQVVYVGENQGDYNQDGAYVGNEQGDYNFVMVGTDSLVATTGVEADLHWRQGFSFLGADRWYGAWSSLTMAAIEGRSTTEDVGGLLALRPGVLFDRETTVLGDVNFSEELNLLQHLRTVDLRAKFDFRQVRDRQYADHPEDRVNRQWQLTGNVNVTRRTSLRLRWQRQDERRYSEESSSSARRSYSSLSYRYELGWNWRPGADLRLGLQGEYLTRDDGVSGVGQREYALKGTGRRRLLAKWTLQGEARLAEVKSDEPAGSVRPWFYSYPGRNIDASLRVAWDPTEYLSVGVSWFARKQGERRWQHDVRVESTARF